MTYEGLTTERIRKKFKNNFDLCNFSINIARNTLLSGNYATLGTLLEMIEQRADDLRADEERAKAK